MAVMCVFKNGSDVCVQEWQRCVYAIVEVCLQVYVQCVFMFVLQVNTYTCTVLIFTSEQDY